MQLKRYEKKLQGTIEEATYTSIPTIEAAANAGVTAQEGEGKSAKDSAIIFIDGTGKSDKLKEKEEEIKKSEDPIKASSTAKTTITKGKSEINASSNDHLNKDDKKDMDEAAKAAEAAFGKTTADVVVPKVEVKPKEEDKTKTKVTEEKPKSKEKEEDKQQEKATKTEKLFEDEGKELDKKDKEKSKGKTKLDGAVHEVTATRKVSEFFKKHKKAIYISTGIAALILTIALYPTVLVPTIMRANQVFYAHTTVPAIQTVLHGMNTGLGKSIGATFANGIWHTAGGAAITTEAANKICSGDRLS